MAAVHTPGALVHQGVIPVVRVEDFMLSGRTLHPWFLRNGLSGSFTHHVQSTSGLSMQQALCKHASNLCKRPRSMTSSSRALIIDSIKTVRTYQSGCIHVK